MAENLEAQGSSRDAFLEKAAAVAGAPRRDIVASREGFLTADIPAIRKVFVDANAGASPAAPFPDELGIILRVRPGAYVRKGDVLASIRADSSLWTRVGSTLEQTFQAADVLDYAPGLEEAIRA